MNKWVITDVESDEPILIYEGSFMDVMDFVNGRYKDEDGVPITREYCHYEGPDAWAPDSPSTTPPTAAPAPLSISPSPSPS